MSAPAVARSAATNKVQPKSGPKPEPKTLFQKYFKSVGPRTYAAQVKEAGNGNHFIVLTEGRRDEKTDEVKKLRLFVFSEDFDQFKDLLRDTFKFIAEHPLPAEVRAKRQKFWSNKFKNKKN
jgi:hypothetical protein